jgi:hypothetical protein
MGRKISDKLNIGMGLMVYDLQIKIMAPPGAWESIWAGE